MQERKDISKAKLEMDKSFVKTIVTLSAGAFGLSLTIIKQFYPIVDQSSLFWVKAAWLSFGLSLFFILAAFITSQYACNRHLQNLEQFLASLDEDTRPNPEPEDRNPWGATTQLLNVLALLLLLAGIGCLLLFAFANVYGWCLYVPSR